jgi:predicted nucleic acid-binding Zn ribbon protein
VPEEADWQRRARLAADALAEAREDARAKGYHPGSRARGGGQRRERDAPDPPDQATEGGPAAPGEPAAGQPAPSGKAAPPGKAAAPRRARRSGRAHRDDPQPLSTAFDGLLADQGWQTEAAVGSVFGRWDQLVGPDVAAHTRPEQFSDGELVVIADSAAWATQMRLLTSAVLRRLNTELGHGTVTRVVVRGPAPPRRMGPLRVRGTREHKDDYG